MFLFGNRPLQAASELIKTSVEPVLEQYRPIIIASLKFSKLTLGTVAPQFTGRSLQTNPFVDFHKASQTFQNSNYMILVSTTGMLVFGSTFILLRFGSYV
jgi:hypothetical protein